MTKEPIHFIWSKMNLQSWHCFPFRPPPVPLTMNSFSVSRFLFWFLGFILPLAACACYSLWITILVLRSIQFHAHRAESVLDFMPKLAMTSQLTYFGLKTNYKQLNSVDFPLEWMYAVLVELCLMLKPFTSDWVLNLAKTLLGALSHALLMRIWTY